MSGTHSERPLHLCKMSNRALWKEMINYAWYENLMKRSGERSEPVGLTWPPGI